MNTLILYMLVLGGIATYIWSLRAQKLDRAAAEKEHQQEGSPPEEDSPATWSQQGAGPTAWPGAQSSHAAPGPDMSAGSRGPYPGGYGGGPWPPRGGGQR